MEAVAEKLLTVEEYFALEETAEVRHEYVDGILLEMPGESKRANRIAINIMIALESQVRDSFLIFLHDIRLRVTATRYRYPDLVVAPFDEADAYNVHEPIFVVEVVSPTSSDTDRVHKLREYTRLTTVQYYAIVDPQTPGVELYSRRADGWDFAFYDASTDVVPLPALNAQLPLARIYERLPN